MDLKFTAIYLQEGIDDHGCLLHALFIALVRLDLFHVCTR